MPKMGKNLTSRAFKIIVLSIFVLMLSSILIAIYIRHAKIDSGETRKISITSNDIQDNGKIAEIFACDGKNINPSFTIKNIPNNTRSLAITMTDVTDQKNWVHWTTWNIPYVKEIILKTGQIPPTWAQGKNDFGNVGYGGPCPPHGELHTYVFRVYALKAILDTPVGADYQELQNDISGQIIDQDAFTGTYQR